MNLYIINTLLSLAVIFEAMSIISLDFEVNETPESSTTPSTINLPMEELFRIFEIYFAALKLKKLKV
jgi:hypothetical protein